MNKLYALVLIFAVSIAGYSQSTVLTGGNNFSVGLCGNGAVYAWGSNESGQIGQGTAVAQSKSSPTPVVFTGLAVGRTFLQVNAGSGAHALALDCSGHVWVWGENVCGQVGNTTAPAVGTYAQCISSAFNPQPSPVPLEAMRGAQPAGLGENGTYLHSIKLIGGGNNFSLAVDSTGNVWSWGENEFGELGNGGAIGNIQPTPVQVVKCAGGNLSNIVYVQGGDQTAYALDAAGKVWAWGKNDNKNLGNGSTGNESGAGSSNCAVQVYKGTSTTSDTSFTATITTAAALGIVPLTGIKQIAAGDTHGMALDSSGQVWTWGGDWAPGQLGQGNNYVTNHFASRVVAPLAYTEFTNSYNFSAPLGACSTGTTPGCTYINNAIFIAAGQASSAIVLATGEVVTFGGQGLYPGSACTSGNMLFSGTLGNGLPSQGEVCQSNATRCQTYTTAPTTTPAQVYPTTTTNGCAGFGVPTYVETAAGVPLKNIVSVARADAWYFATNDKGQVYAWGFNGGGPGVTTNLTAIGNWGGELGNGTTADAPYAVQVTLPGGCSIATPCPIVPDLGTAFTMCPGSVDTLVAGEPQLGYTYTWSSSPTGALGSWTTLKTGVGDSAYGFTMGTSAIYYKVLVSYKSPCGTVCSASDSILVSPDAPAFTVSGTYCSTNTNVQFNAFDPTGKAQFEWFENATTATPIAGATGTGDTLLILPKTSTSINTSFASGTACDYAVFVQDTASYAGILNTTAPALPEQMAH